jgi:hypothetical protein
MRISLVLCAAVIVAVVGVVAIPERPSAQAATSVVTKSGVNVEEVRVGGSCVVVVARAGAGASDDIAAVPCRP